MNAITERQISILRQALGLEADGTGESTRNHFCAKPGSTDHPDCMALVAAGHMWRREKNNLTQGHDVFYVFPAALAVAAFDEVAA